MLHFRVVAELLVFHSNKSVRRIEETPKISQMFLPSSCCCSLRRPSSEHGLAHRRMMASPPVFNRPATTHDCACHVNMWADFDGLHRQSGRRACFYIGKCPGDETGQGLTLSDELLPLSPLSVHTWARRRNAMLLLGYFCRWKSEASRSQRAEPC